MTRPYRPSNGTEGMAFDEQWCARCQRDSAFREDENAEPCHIIGSALFYAATDPEYPREWVEDESGPRCTAFLAIVEDEELEASRTDPRQGALPI